MVEQRVERKLAAVLVADAVAYSRLMELDEEGTHKRLSALQRELFTKTIREYRGRIVKNTGDGVLADFASVVDAVRCGVDIQRGMLAYNDGSPEDRRIVFRIGINLGDVIVSPGDIYGDGVNVAARLEGLADSGGLCISGSAYDQVRDKLAFPFSDRGEQSIKNISRPVRVFSLGPDAIAALPDHSSTAETSRPPWYRSRAIWPASIAALVVIAAGVWLGTKPGNTPRPSAAAPQFSMIVLPFSNLSGDPAQDYLPDVITEGLTTALSRIKGAFVIARSTAFTYKGKPVNVRQLGKDLGIRYVLEGSTQSSGGKVRVNAQLIDADTGAHIWADQFDADRANLLDMQDEVITRLSRALSIELVDVEIARVKRSRVGNLDAQDLAMQCLSGITRSTEFDEVTINLRLCQRALQIDDKNVLALSLIAGMTMFPVITAQSSNPAEAIKSADDYASKALALDPNFANAHSAKAMVFMAQGRHEEAIVEAEKCLTLNPLNMEGYLVLGIANNFLVRPDRTLEVADKAIRLSPRDPILWGFYEIKGEAYFILRQDDKAIAWLRRQWAAAPLGEPYSLALLTSALALSGKLAEAREVLGQYLANASAQSKTIAQFRERQLSLANSPEWVAYNDRIADGLRLAGMAEK